MKNEKEGGARQVDGSLTASPRLDEQPPARSCEKHPNGTTEACGPCKSARLVRGDWDRTTGEREAAERTDRRNRINRCEECDGQGIRIEPHSHMDRDLPAIKCDHQHWNETQWNGYVPEVTGTRER